MLKNAATSWQHTVTRW